MTMIDQTLLAAALPPMSGDLRTPGLAAPVAVHRDRWGIPHIRAQGSADAWFALGFVHAQDRLFQMDLNRMRALGRSAEWFGQPAVPADILARQLDMAGSCTRDFVGLGEDARGMLNRYAEGVNAFLASDAPRPIEYTLLKVTPEHWEPWHSIAVMRRLGLLMGSIWFKLWRMLALPVVGPDVAMTLRYDDGGADLLTIPPGVTAQRWHADLAALAPSVKALLAAMGQEETGGGSNNWAVGPARSATGRPILAGDPHRVFEIPGMYAQHHVACDDFDMIGLSVPGVPGFPHYGHNGHVAYCVTHAFVDIHDLFLEHFDTTGSRTQFGADWESVTTRRERIAVRDAAPHDFVVTVTRHGPIVAGDPQSGAALALRSVQFAETDRSFDCLPRMARARTVAELYEATRGWGLIDHNLVAGDVAGSIGHRVRALVPRRPRTNGWLPVPGWTGAHEWDGWIAHEAMPEVINPPESVIVTANNRVVADGPDYLCTDCHPPYRAQRMLDLLSAIKTVSPGDAAAIHADVLSPHVALMQTWLMALEPLPDERAERLRTELLAWDGEMRAEASAPAAYMALRRAITALVASRSGLADAGKQAWGAVSPGVLPMNQLWWAVPGLIRSNDSRLLNGWTWQQVLSEALRTVEPITRTWGDIHRPRFAHPLSALYPGAAALLDPPSLPIGGDTDTVQANGLSAVAGLDATYGAIARYVYDVGNWDACRWSVFHGTAGHPGSPHYADQNPVWSRCEMVPMLYDSNVITAEAETSQRLVP